VTGTKVLIDEAAPPGWDAHLDGAGEHCAYFRSDFVEFAAGVFGFRRFHLHAHADSGEIVGVLPLVLQQSRLFGRRLVSMPFFNYGGAVAADDTVRRALADSAATLARELGVRELELRDRRPLDGVVARLDKVSPMLDLPDSVEALSKKLGSKLRSQIKRAERVAPEVVHGGAELVPEFFTVFAETMRDLGTPVYPRRFFDELFARCGRHCTAFVLRVNGRPAAAAILIAHGTTLEIPWAASLREFRAESVNMRLYWEVLRYAVEKGYRRFDFGRSTVDAGTYRFKLQWGSVPVPSYWLYPLEDASAAPAGKDDSAAMALARRTWTRLPVGMATRIGSLISPGLPW
jgi:serine/alanine adding enzyme